MPHSMEVCGEVVRSIIGFFRRDLQYSTLPVLKNRDVVSSQLFVSLVPYRFCIVIHESVMAKPLIIVADGDLIFKCLFANEILSD